ncbi:acyl carrier protein [Streptomyces sp. 7N604]|uniref:acyl carrier protein n=1 Tax=Streptomyces sp. 7N604 TaxID=3457415 RepID=UPI003FD59B91
MNNRISSVLTRFGVDADEIHAERTLDDLGFDSLARLELVELLQEEFNIQISDEEASKATTVGDIAGFLTSKAALH